MSRLTDAQLLTISLLSFTLAFFIAQLALPAVAVALTAMIETALRVLVALAAARALHAVAYFFVTQAQQPPAPRFYLRSTSAAI